jgi:Rod binding domain-containing protein
MNFGISAYANVAQMSAEAAGAGAAGAAGAGGAIAGGNAAGTAVAAGQLRKLKKAATQFEAMLLEKWWSSMKQSGLGQDDDGDPGKGTLDTMGMQAMSTAIASAGGIGIAAMLVRSLQGEIASEAASKATDGGAVEGAGRDAKSN